MSYRAAIWSLIIGGSLILSPHSFAFQPLEIQLWEGVAPGSEGADAVVETVEERGTAEKPNRKITGVTVPTVTIYRPEVAINTGTAIVICPGGGYSGVTIDKEGHDIARYLNTIGVTGIVIKYRLPRPDGFIFNHDVPLSDVARAIRLTRHHAKDWGLDPNRVGVMGFSAGGHLASTVATHFDSLDGKSMDSIDRLPSRPDFQALIYPVISFKEGVGHSGSRRNLVGEAPAPGLVELYSNELHVSAETPPAFLISTYDDRVRAENSLLYFKALRAVDVPAELHIYEVGGHGYGIIQTGKPVAGWHYRLGEWMQNRGLLETEKQEKQGQSRVPE
ncbi:alpha/beta hydrolase [Pseudomonadota bacterium]